MTDILKFAYQATRMKNNLGIMKDLFEEVDKESDIIKKLKIIEEFLDHHIDDLNEDDKKTIWNKYLEIGGMR